MLRNGSGMVIIKDLKYWRHTFRLQRCEALYISWMVKKVVDVAKFITPSLICSSHIKRTPNICHHYSRELMRLYCLSLRSKM